MTPRVNSNTSITQLIAMELWLLLLSSLFFISASTLLFFFFRTTANKNENKKTKLPPGPPAYPLIGNLIWLNKSIINDLESVLRGLCKQYGPIITVRIGSRLAVFISDRTLAHRALVEHGASFSSRPTPLPASLFLSSNQHIISSAPYGPLWRLLRRNLISEILNTSRIKLYAPGRQWVLGVLLHDLSVQLASSSSPVVPVRSFQFAMFCLLALMCFGEKLDEKAIREIEVAHRTLLVYSSTKLSVLNFFPSISKYIFKNRLDTAISMLRTQKAAVVPLFNARREHKRRQRERQLSQQESKERYVYSYLDSLLDVRLPEEGGRGLTDDEMVALCAEFLNAGTDTTTTALQWIMAELVRHPETQRKLAEEVDGVMMREGNNYDGRVREEDVQRMPYVKAVVMEGMRRHPPTHFVLQHAMSEEIEFEGYVIPKKATVNFMVSEMHWDEKVWEDPMEFRPERFLSGEGVGVDITGSREIKMMPFGVGRRICPGLGLGVLHLEYFVANLVREFEWKKLEGEEVDMSEKPEFAIVMKNPLRARLIPRRK